MYTPQSIIGRTLIAPTHSFWKQHFFSHENPGCTFDVQYYVSLAMGIDFKTSVVVQRVVEELQRVLFDLQPLHCSHCPLLTALTHLVDWPASSYASK